MTINVFAVELLIRVEDAMSFLLDFVDKRSCTIVKGQREIGCLEKKLEGRKRLVTVCFVARKCFRRAI